MSARRRWNMSRRTAGGGRRQNATRTAKARSSPDGSVELTGQVVVAGVGQRVDLPGPATRGRASDRAISPERGELGTERTAHRRGRIGSGVGHGGHQAPALEPRQRGIQRAERHARPRSDELGQTLLQLVSVQVSFVEQPEDGDVQHADDRIAPHLSAATIESIYQTGLRESRGSAAGDDYPFAVDFLALRAEGRPGTTPGSVDYRLARRRALRGLRSGDADVGEFCDAQGELLRVAASCSELAGEPCPVCGEDELRIVRFVFGPRLPKGGRCVTSKGRAPAVGRSVRRPPLLRGRGVHRLSLEPPPLLLSARCRAVRLIDPDDDDPHALAPPTRRARRSRHGGAGKGSGTPKAGSAKGRSKAKAGSSKPRAKVGRRKPSGTTAAGGRRSIFWRGRRVVFAMLLVLIAAMGGGFLALNSITLPVAATPAETSFVCLAGRRRRQVRARRLGRAVQRVGEPHLAPLPGHAEGARAGGAGGRGPRPLRALRHRSGRHRPGALRGPAYLGGNTPGRLDDHPAVREDCLPQPASAR